jgi:HAD superfamily hydrolase (TIGR01509 family)
VVEEKDRTFKTMAQPEPFEGVREMIKELGCKKAVASGSTKHDVCSILDEIVGTDRFDAIVTSDDVKKGKPDPLAFFTACKKMRIAPADAVVVENAPLGVRAANNAGIPCYVTLNSTVLSRQDFDGMIPADRIFEKTSSLKGLLKSMCS